MPLQPGARIGPYEVTGLLGAGGMGEVYRARDAKLNRDVAIKVLPAAVAGDPDRLARFEREAQALGALNHPNIAAIYGSHDSPAALVMELVEGDDLSAIIKRGPVEIGDAIAIARQIAEALEAAHEHGLIHRDLKPANVKVKADGSVKVLDFGLAKALAPDVAGASAEAMNSPTLTNRATQAGTILGTAAYMAPEQARGRVVDRRADIWAFGVVLYEVLTGRRAFDGDDVSTTLAAVLMRDPEWVALPPGTPAAISTLLHRCLDRDPRQRLRDIGEARVLLASPGVLKGDSSALAAPSPSPSRTARAAWLVAAAFAVVAAVIGWQWAQSSRSDGAGHRLEVLMAPPDDHVLGNGFALSPDGQRLVMEAWSDAGSVSLWVRDLASGPPKKLSGTEGGTQPFWSPNGQEIGFFAEAKLKKVDLQGAPPQVICDAPEPRGGTWGPDGTIVFAASFRTGLERVAASGGKPVPLTTLDQPRKEKSHRWPVFLPGGTHIVFLAQTGEATAKDDASTIEALDLRSAVRTRLVTANSSALYSPEGFLLFYREGALRAQAFDAARLTMSGPVFPVASGVAFDSNEFVSATVAANGILAHAAASGSRFSTLLEVDRAGRPIRTIAESVIVEGGMALSHDETRLAVALTAQGARDTDIWIYDLARNTSGPLTFEAGGERSPVWGADDKQIFFLNDRVNDGVVFARYTDGRGQAMEVARNGSGMWPWSVSRDGRRIIVGLITDTTSRDVWQYDLQTKKLTPIVSSPAVEDTAALSPDDRWLAHDSDDKGRPEIFVRSLGDDAGRWGVSTDGGNLPAWRADGRELYFVSPRGQLMAAEIHPGPPMRISTPKELFKANFRGSRSTPYTAFASGQKFIIDVLPDADRQLLTLVTHWSARKP